jgi:S1-C subfamily serine protease
MMRAGGEVVVRASIGSFQAVGFGIAVSSVFAFGCYAPEQMDPSHAESRGATACDALAAYAPWDGLPPSAPEPKATTSKTEDAPPANEERHSLASLGFMALDWAVETERVERRMQSLGPITGEGAEDVATLRASLHVGGAIARNYLAMERETSALGAMQLTEYRDFLTLGKACAARRFVPICKELRSGNAEHWHDTLVEIVEHRDGVHVAAIRAPLDRLAEDHAKATPLMNRLLAVSKRIGEGMSAESRHTDEAVERLVARCGRPAPKPAMANWIAAPEGTRPRDLVMVIRSQSAPALADRALRLFGVSNGARTFDAAPGPSPTLGSFGTGFLVVNKNGTKERAFVVTNRHVVAHGARFTLESDSGEELPHAEVIYEDRGADIAVLSLASVPKTGGGFVFAKQPAHDGEAITLAGFPGLGQRPAYQIVRGAISNERLEFGGAKILQHTAPTDPGASGSPVLDASGQVVGVAMGKFVGRDAASMAVPRDALLDAVERALEVEHLQNDASYRRDELMRACLSVVGAAIDGHPANSSRISRQLVENKGPTVLAVALDTDEGEAMRAEASHDILGALDSAVAADVSMKIATARPSPLEMCSSAYHAKNLEASGPVTIEIQAVDKLALSFIFERGAYKLFDY